MTDVTPTKIRMSLEEFMAMPESKEHAELIHGELVMAPAPKEPHEETQSETYLYVGPLVKNIGGIIRGPNADLHLNGKDVLRPDIFAVLGGNSNCKLGDDGYWHGAPDLVIEILSPSTEEFDRETKYDLYEQASVREYWMMNPVLQFVEVYELENGRFLRQGAYNKERTFVSKVLNVQIEVGNLFGRRHFSR